jgi:hypothetical protein
MIVKSLKLVVFLCLLTIIQSCYRCEFSHYACNYYDNSFVIIDNETYSFRAEDIRTTDIYENDSVIVLNYSISRKGNITGSNVNIGFGFIINIKLKKLSDGSFTFDSGLVEFIKDNVWGDFYNFKSQNLNLIEYSSCRCQKEIGNTIFTPEKLIINIKGVITNNISQKDVDFDIKYETKKVEVKDC